MSERAVCILSRPSAFERKQNRVRLVLGVYSSGRKGEGRQVESRQLGARSQEFIPNGVNLFCNIADNLGNAHSFCVNDLDLEIIIHYQFEKDPCLIFRNLLKI